MPTPRFLLIATALVVATPLAVQGQGVPANGAAVLERMRARYATTWYSTLEFSQKTTIHGRNGVREETWHERLWQSPLRGTLLRIDQGPDSLGNSTINTADSGYTIRGHKLVQANTNGNFFLPLIEGVYLQPVERTVRDLASTHIDLDKVHVAEWNGVKVWVVGATAASDSVSTQFWVDVDRLVVVRVLIALAPGQAPLDVHLDSYVKTGGGWLATKVSMFIDGKPRQIEEYYDWKTRHPIDPTVFEAAVSAP
ncbi:MAG: hypothetical protein ABJC19_02005 [Gemmatimonadota bacterium]